MIIFFQNATISIFLHLFENIIIKPTYMKTFLKLCALFLLMQSFTCSKDNDNTQAVSAEALANKKQKIVTDINTFSCSATVGCNSVAFGSKPCGGPREYLVFSNAVNLTQLQTLVGDYNQAEAAYNLQHGIADDCMFVGPPANIGCVNGKCGILN